MHSIEIMTKCSLAYLYKAILVLINGSTISFQFTENVYRESGQPLSNTDWIVDIRAENITKRL